MILSAVVILAVIAMLGLVLYFSIKLVVEGFTGLKENITAPKHDKLKEKVDRQLRDILNKVRF